MFFYSSQPFGNGNISDDLPSHTASNLTKESPGNNKQVNNNSHRKTKVLSQNDSGIGPEQVTLALEAMISKLNNDVDPSKSRKTSTVPFRQIQVVEGGFSTIQDINLVTRDNSFNVIQTDSKQSKNSGIASSSPTNGSILCTSPKTKDLKLTLHETSSQENLSETLMPNISITKHSDVIESKSNGETSSGTSRTSFCDPDSLPPSPSEFDSLVTAPKYHPFLTLSSYYIEGTPESLAEVHKLNFPDHCIYYQSNTQSPSRKANSCSYFSVDLGKQMTEWHRCQYDFDCRGREC